LTRRRALGASRAPGARLGADQRARSDAARRGRHLRHPGTNRVALVASGSGAVLVWTGLALAWRRFRGWRRRMTAAGALSVPPQPGREVSADWHWPPPRGGP